MAFAQPHPRLSGLSNASQSSIDHQSPTASTTRFSLPIAPSAATKSARPNIYDRNLNKTRTSEVSASAFSFLFSEIVQYTQNRVSGINDLERRLNTLGYRIGTRILELMVWRAESSSKNPKREIRFLPALMSIQTQVWRAVFGKPADAIEKSVENADEYMIIDNDPIIERHISVPRDLSQLSCSSFTAGIVEAVMDGLGFIVKNCLSEIHDTINDVLGVRGPISMVKIKTLNITPPLINSSCAWASDYEQLTELYESPLTGAVTTRTATLNGFQETPSHSVAFTKSSISSINSYGYSPHPLASYLQWIKQLVESSISGDRRKPFIISITTSDAAELRSMMQEIQRLRKELGDMSAPSSLIGLELNTSCPNIPGSPPTAYNFPLLTPLLTVLEEEYTQDPTLSIGLKLPPFVYHDQFIGVIDGVKRICQIISEGISAAAQCPIAFFTCTNTLGNSLIFNEQTEHPETAPSEEVKPFAVPTGLGGVAGEMLHALALGNVHSFTQLLRDPYNSVLHNIRIIGVGGVTCKEAADRMRHAGATVVGCATLLGKEGVRAFEIISGS